ncbi:MAG: hypothetical protein ACTJHU_10820 [Mycetocola sp.]
MTIALAWALLAVGCGLYLASMVVTVKENEGFHIPLMGSAPLTSRLATWLRVGGVPFVIAGLFWLGSDLSLWGVGVFVATLVGAVFVPVPHNRRLARLRAGDQG